MRESLGFFRHDAGKKAITLCLALMLMAGVFSLLPVQTAEAAVAKPVFEPIQCLRIPKNHSTLAYGESYSLKGVFTLKKGTGKITAVNATISKGGVNRFIFEAHPYSIRYDMHNTKGTNGKTMNETFQFGKLGVGHWRLTVNITAKNQTKVTNYSFTRTFNIAQTIYASGCKFPVNYAELTQGKSFTLAGVFKADVGKIAAISASIKDSSGTAVATFYATPNTQTFNIKTDKNSGGKTMNQKLKFGSLVPGDYTFTLIVKGTHESEWGKAASYSVKRRFVVVKATPTPTSTTPSPTGPQTITPSGESYPDNNAVLASKAFALKGIYKVNNGKISKVKATLKNSASEVKALFNALPDAATFDVCGTLGTNGKTMNATIAFGSLEAGKYTLKLEITGDDGASYSLTRTFTVGLAPKITLSGLKTPSVLTEGQNFTLQGKAKASTGVITSVKVTVKDSSDTVVTGFSKTVAPDSDIFDFVTLSNKFVFSKLAPDTYTFNITIKAKNGTLSAPTYTCSLDFVVNPK